MNHAVFGVIGIFLIASAAAHAQTWEKQPDATEQDQAAALEQCQRVARASTPPDYAPVPPTTENNQGSHQARVRHTGTDTDTASYQLQDDPYAPGSISHIEREHLLNLCMEEAGWSRGDSDLDQ
jgi:hypothetical protein